VSTKFVQPKALGFKLAPLRGACIQVSDFRAIMALLFFIIMLFRLRELFVKVLLVSWYLQNY
jgi:hypothetical protein